MSDGAPGEGGFLAFAQRVAEDAALAGVLRPISDRDAFVAAAVATGAARGYRFGADEVEAAMAANRHGWFSPSTPTQHAGGTA